MSWMDICKLIGMLSSLLFWVSFNSHFGLQEQGLLPEKLLAETGRATHPQFLTFANYLMSRLMNPALPQTRETAETLVYGRKILEREALEDLSCRKSSCKLNYQAMNTASFTEHVKGSAPANGGILDQSERLIPSGPDRLPLDVFTQVFPLAPPSRPSNNARKPRVVPSNPSPIRSTVLEAKRLVPSDPDPLHHSSNPQNKLPPKRPFSKP